MIFKWNLNFQCLHKKCRLQQNYGSLRTNRHIFSKFPKMHCHCMGRAKKWPPVHSILWIMIMMTIVMITIMNCFYGMVDLRTRDSHISRWEHRHVASSVRSSNRYYYHYTTEILYFLEIQSEFLFISSEWLGVFQLNFEAQIELSIELFWQPCTSNWNICACGNCNYLLLYTIYRYKLDMKLKLTCGYSLMKEVG